MTNSSDDQAIIETQTDALINQINERIRALGQQLADEDDHEFRWMIEHSTNPAVIALLPEMTVGMLHVLDAVGRLEPVNGITISKEFHIPKGSVSKVTRKLAAKKLIVTESLPNNKKEILFHMTPLGKEVFDIHRAMHDHMEEQVTLFLQRYTTSELQFVAKLIGDFAEARWFMSQESDE